MSPRRFLGRALRLWLAPAPRPYVVWAAVDLRAALRLYRAQNIVWVWLGIAAALSALAWLLRPALGPVLISPSEMVDAIRNGLFCYGGLLIAIGVWWIRRQLEVFGHVLFASGASLTAVVTATAHLPGSHVLAVATTAGVAAASAFRAFYLVRWIGSDAHAPASREP